MPHVTASALDAILKGIKEAGLPDLISRRAMREARDQVMHANTQFGPILKTMDVIGQSGEILHIPYADPFAMLAVTVEHHPEFARMLQRCLEERPPSPDQPWSIILYTDEVTPGDPVAPFNLRKLQACYWSFLELGANVLSKEEAWFTLMTEFSEMINQVASGLSQTFGSLVKTFFQPDGFNIGGAGIGLQLGEVNIRLWAKAGIVLQDGGAHKYVWCSRGHGASKSCLLCNNLFSRESRLVDTDATHMLVCDALRYDDLIPTSDEELRTRARFLAGISGTAAPAEFDNYQQALGLTYLPHNILLDRYLDTILSPTESFTHDPMHCFFADGIVNICVYLLFEAFIGARMTTIYETFQEYASHWKWPKRLNAHRLEDVFGRSRRDKHRKAQRIKCHASDMLSLMPVLVAFTHQVLLRLGTCDAECQAFLALAGLVDLVFSSAKMHVQVQPFMVLAAAHRYLDLFVAAFGMDWLIPKDHWPLHFADTLEDQVFVCQLFRT